MKHQLNVSITAAMLALILAGCSSSTAASTAASAVSESATSTVQTVVSNNVSTETSSDSDGVYTDRDLEQSANLTNAVYETLQNDTDITITEEGVYVISGTATNASIIVEANDTAKVQIVLDGASITNTDSPAIYVKSADKVFITTTSSDNTLTVNGTFTADGETNLDAVIYSKDDLVLNGTGTLTISSTANGISCKDDLKVTGGTYNITSTEDAIEVNDSISICAGNFTIKTSKDGLHCEYEEDTTVGSILITGGTFDITAGDDGIQAVTVLQIDDGTFNISAAEGLEATEVIINGGTISISASDDGINAASKSSGMSVYVEINDGDITIVMGSGDTDAVDANGSIYVNGGNISITGNSSFDYDVSGELNGGTVTVNGQVITTMPSAMMGGGGKGGMGRQ